MEREFGAVERLTQFDAYMEDFQYAIIAFVAVAIIILPITAWAIRHRLAKEKRFEKYHEEHYRYIRAKRQFIEKEGGL